MTQRRLRTGMSRKVQVGLFETTLIKSKTQKHKKGLGLDIIISVESEFGICSMEYCNNVGICFYEYLDTTIYKCM